MIFNSYQKSFKDCPPAGMMKWFIIELLKGKSSNLFEILKTD